MDFPGTPLPAGYVMACEGEYGLQELVSQLTNQVLRGNVADTGVVALLYGLSASVALSLYSIGMRSIAVLFNNNDWVCMFYLNINVALLLVPLGYFVGEVPVVQASPLLRQTGFWILLAFAGLSGILINVATMLQIRYTSALTHNVSGTFKATVQSSIGWWTGKKFPVLSTCFGTIIVILGCAAYALVRQFEDLLKKEEQAAAAAAVAAKEIDDAALTLQREEKGRRKKL